MSASSASFFFQAVLAWSVFLQTAALHQMAAMSHLQLSENDTPIMMFSHGCTGSTVTDGLLGAMLKAHGINETNWSDVELIRKIREKVQEDGAVDSLQAVTREFENIAKFVRQSNQTLHFKNQLRFAQENSYLMATLQALHTRSFFLNRRNLIDDLHCRVTDFCNEPRNNGLGYLVDETGTEMPCEFRGRVQQGLWTSKSNRTKTGLCGDKGCSVYFNTNNLLQFLEKLKEENQDNRAWLSGTALRSKSTSASAWNWAEFSFEDLFTFEYAPDENDLLFTNAVKEWSKLMQHLGIKPQQQTIRQTFKTFGTYPSPRPSRDTIYNSDEVRHALKGTTYEDMWRT